MSLTTSDFNIEYHTIEPITLIHEVSTTVFYIGVSINGRDTSKPIWKIKKIEKEGDVWNVTKFPNGNQNYSFIWDDRVSLTYV